MPTIARFHCSVQTPIAKVSMPSCAAQRRPDEICVGSPDSETTVTKVTDFSAMLRPKTNHPAATSATFQASSGKYQQAARRIGAMRPEAISDHSRALALRMLSRPRGQVSASHSAEPSEASDLGPSTHRKKVPKKIAVPTR